MECNRLMFISIVLIFVCMKITFSELVQKNVSSASIQLLDDWNSKELPTKLIKTQQKSLDVLKTYTNCSGFEVIFYYIFFSISLVN